MRLKEVSRLSGLAIRLTWRTSPPLVLGILLILVLQAALPPLELALSKLVLDRAALDLGLSGRPAGLARELPLAAWIAVAALAIAARQLIEPFAATFQGIAGDRLSGRVTGELIRAANRWRGLARFEDPAIADDLELARRGATRGGLDMMVYGTRALAALATAGGLALMLAGLHPLAPPALVLASLPLMAREWVYRDKVGSHLYAQAPETRRLQYGRRVMLDLAEAKDIRLYGLGPFFLRRYDEVYARTMGALDAKRRRLAGGISRAGALAALASGTAYIYLVWRVADGALTVGDFVLYAGAITMLQANLATLAFDIGFLPMVLHFLPSLFRVLEAPPDLPVPAHRRLAPQPVRQGLRFEGVWFTYPGTPKPALRGISFALRPGESLALVGHNGAGKTTIVKLLLRLYDPTEGRITLDGADLREYDPENLRVMGVVFQDFARYELTAGENIAAGDLSALGDERRLLEAAREAGAAALVADLPDGLDTRLGREFGERELSGGEWQKLALARAFLRPAQVLVLDEPTASLDVRAEYDVYQRFAELTRDRATLLISHRFSTVRMAGRILYLEGGRVAEEGSHAELMQLNGEYARLYRLQAAQYLEEVEG